MNSTSTNYQSRWGFHPCDYELFSKLRRLHKWYWQTVYDFHRWHRWWRKLPQNRQGTEPRFCAAFVADEPWCKPVIVRGERGFRLFPKTVVDHGVPEWFKAARVPQAEPVAAFDSQVRERIEALYLTVSPYFAE